MDQKLGALHRALGPAVDERQRDNKEDHADHGGGGTTLKDFQRTLAASGGDDAGVDHAKEGLTHDEAGGQEGTHTLGTVSYTHLTLPTMSLVCRSRWWPDH